MKKFLIVSDIHVHKYKAFNQDNRRLTNLIRLLKDIWICANEQNAVILFCGDMFNNMQLIQTEVVDAVTKLFEDMSKEYPNVTWLMISGNHDYATKNFYERPAVSALSSLARVSANVLILDNRSWSGSDCMVYGVPYYEYEEGLVKAMEDVSRAAEMDGHKYKILLMHQILGFGHELVPDDIDPADILFEPFDMVFNGHIHTHSELGPNFYNVGSPVHRDAGDIGQSKGFLLLTVPDNKVERILTEGYPEFRQLPAGQPLPIEWEGDYIIDVPEEIQVAPEEQEIREQFNHTKKSRAELLNNFTTIKLANKPKKFQKAVATYGAKLLHDEVEV